MSKKRGYKKVIKHSIIKKNARSKHILRRNQVTDSAKFHAYNRRKKESVGNDLLSQGATPQVPSALASLTAGFEMGPGVSSLLRSPTDSILLVSFNLRSACSFSLRTNVNFSAPIHKALGR